MDPEIVTIPLKVPAYLLKANDGFVMIDTGDASDRNKLEKALDQIGVTGENLKLILLTHGDFDHAGNAAYLKKELGVKIAMHAGDVEMVEFGDMNLSRQARPDRITIFGRMIMAAASLLTRVVKLDTLKPDLLVEDGQGLAEYGVDARVLHLPGHSKGSIGILTEQGDLFCGDLLMNMIKPDLHFMIDNLEDTKASVNRLRSLEIRTVYPGHGKPFAMERLKI